MYLNHTYLDLTPLLTESKFLMHCFHQRTKQEKDACFRLLFVV